MWKAASVFVLTLCATVRSAPAALMLGDTLDVTWGFGTLSPGGPPNLLLRNDSVYGPVADGPADKTRIDGNVNGGVDLDVDDTRMTFHFDRIPNFGPQPPDRFRGAMVNGFDFVNTGRVVTGFRTTDLYNLPLFDYRRNAFVHNGSVFLNTAVNYALPDARITLDVVTRPANRLMLVGNTITAEYRGGDLVQNDTTLLESTVMPSVTDDFSDTAAVTASGITAEFDGEQLTIELPNIGFSSSVPFVGLVFRDLYFANASPTLLTGLTLISSDFIPAQVGGEGLGGEDLMILPNGDIAVNFQGLSLIRGKFVIELQTIPEPSVLAGDYNEDGKVDAADYVAWRKNPGGFPANAHTTWRSNFGQTAGSGAGAIADTAVPEPATLVLLMFAAAGISLRRRKRG